MKIVLPNVYKEREGAKEMFMIQFWEERNRAQYGICKMVSTAQTQEDFCGLRKNLEGHTPKWDTGLPMNHFPFFALNGVECHVNFMLQF